MDCVSAAVGWHSLVPVDDKFFRLPKELSRWLFFAGVVRFSSEIFVFLNVGKKVTAGNPDEETN